MTALVRRRFFWKDYLVGILLGAVAIFVIDLGAIHYATSWWPWPFAKEGVAVLIGLLVAIFLGIAEDDGLWVFPPCGWTMVVLLLADLFFKYR